MMEMQKNKGDKFLEINGEKLKNVARITRPHNFNAATTSI